MNKEKELYYAKKLKEIGIEQDSEKIIIKDGDIIRIHFRNEFHYIPLERSYKKEIYSNFNTDELLEMLPKYIIDDAIGKSFMFHFNIYMSGNNYNLNYFNQAYGMYFDDIEAETIRECIFKALIELDKLGLLKGEINE